MLKGNYIRLKGFEHDYLEKLNDWMNDFELLKNIMRIEPSIKYFTQKWYEELHYDNKRKMFAIVCEGSGEFIGCIGVNNINYIDRNAEYYVYIGNKKFEGQGFAFEATILFLKYLFNYLNLHKIYLNVREDNVKALNLYKKVGFNIEGTLIDEKYIGGKYINIMRMAILKGEFEYEKGSNITI